MLIFVDVDSKISASASAPAAEIAPIVKRKRSIGQCSPVYFDPDGEQNVYSLIDPGSAAERYFTLFEKRSVQNY